MPVVVGGKKSIRPVIHAAVDSHENEVPERLNSRIRQTELEFVPIEQLKPNRRNAKKHPERQIDLLVENYKLFGFTQPIIIDEDGLILCGHARYHAALKAGITQIPAIRLSHLSPAEKRALAIADNKLAELGEWDLDILAEELGLLFDFDTNLSFDPRTVGFEIAEVDQMLLDEPNTKRADPADQFQPAAPAAAPITQQGELWMCGEHKLVCGDALKESDYQTLMGDEQAETVFADAPHDVPNAEDVGGRREIRADLKMSPPQSAVLLQILCKNVLRYVQPGSVVYLGVDWRHMSELQAAADPMFGALKNLIVWVKSNAGMGGLYRSKHEMILVYTTPGRRPANNFARGRKGRSRTDVWSYPTFNNLGGDCEDEPRTEKPVALVADALLDFTNRGGIVLDPYGGSGTTMIAAERTGRRARLIEIDPLNCDLIVQRWKAFFGKTARLAETNETFDEVKARRSTAATLGARS